MAGQRTNAPQDDQREQEQLRIFGLRQEPGSSREDNDARLDLVHFSSQKIELKTTTKDSITTARDFGLDHINNWRSKHMLASFYDPSGNEISWSLLIPNIALNSWLDEQVRYIRYDLSIIEALIKTVDLQFLNELRCSVFSESERYEGQIIEDLLKQQIGREAKAAFIDVDSTGVSPDSLNDAIKKRLLYLVSRGVTRNNPHIGKNFISRVIADDPDLRFVHERGDYQSSSKWIRQQLSKYAI